VSALVLTRGQGNTALGIELVVGGLIIAFLFSDRCVRRLAGVVLNVLGAWSLLLGLARED
jgi:hypothetical protein